MGMGRVPAQRLRGGPLTPYPKFGAFIESARSLICVNVTTGFDLHVARRASDPSLGPAEPFEPS